MAKAKRFDAAAILDSVEPGRNVGALPRWLDADADRAEAFRAVMVSGQSRGHSIQRLLAAWNESAGDGEDRCPVKYNQVRMAVRQWEAERAAQSRR
jgi:hypothetical protein